MRRTALLISICLLLVLAVRSLPEMHLARADEGAVRIKSMTLSVLPEYDEPRVLVVYRGELDGVRSFPVEVHFRVPRGADVRETCAIQAPDDEHLCQLFQTKPAGDDLLVTFAIPLPTFFLEFYFGDVASSRNLDYRFRSESPVERLELVVQHPLRASDFSITPADSVVTEDDQGFLYHHQIYQRVEPGQPLEVKVAYRKGDDNPSVPKEPPVISPAPQDDRRVDLILVGAGLLLTIGLVIIIYVGMDRLGRSSVVVVRSLGAGTEASAAADSHTPERDRGHMHSRDVFEVLPPVSGAAPTPDKTRPQPSEGSAPHEQKGMPDC